MTSGEVAALNELKTATDLECEKAGISIAEFKRHCRQATQP